MQPSLLSVYFIMGSTNVKGRSPLAVLEQALQAGITMFQLREKGAGCLTGEHYIQFARQCQHLCQRYRVPFIVNDDVELALALEADGIHVGQDDIPIEQIVHRFEQKIVGISVHTREQYVAAIAGGASYIGAGPIYATSSKPDAKKPQGPELIRQLRAYDQHFPIVAIGGIDEHRSADVMNAGANGIAVISAIAGAEDVGNKVKLLRDIVSSPNSSASVQLSSDKSRLLL